ncbi:hypothetical protein MIND_00553300 [Mycena indigotica]|uniref:CENP-V/GFA domain-containing protein n=1 Tax=Mycena indigotica TaxID=2126181 RepID=A0A8H6WCP4_9AGAR|nr:uncharacterized protein MIND_00553300 [Mycena indigotica]KAF7307584.1 hypothetical protein MIND_00553300 [Mycena indigotica]
MPVYLGNCHCGAFKFTLTAADELKHAFSCDCSICSRNGYVLVKDGELVATKGDFQTTLSSYSFGKHQAEHKFCPKCGTSIAIYISSKSLTLVNLRAIEGIDLDSLSINSDFKGSQTEPAYQAPTHPVPSIEPPSDSAVYNGSCHCGAVAYTLVQPNKITTVTECNCSICSRNGARWAYILARNLTVRDAETETTEYDFNTKQGKHTFCKTCGVVVYIRFAGPEGTMLDPAKRALNVRTLNGIDLESFEVTKANGKAFPPAYVVPE